MHPHSNQEELKQSEIDALLKIKHFTPSIQPTSPNSKLKKMSSKLHRGEDDREEAIIIEERGGA